MRPKEIRLLQINQIDVRARQIKATAPTAKTGDRFIPVCDELLELIESLNLTKLPLNFYVFGKMGFLDRNGWEGTILQKDISQSRINWRLMINIRYTGGNTHGW